MTRIRLDKQINKAPAANFIPVTDANGEMQYQTVASVLAANGSSVQSVDSMQVVGNDLVLKYTDQNNVQQTLSQSLAVFAADVKLQGAILDNPSAHIWNLVLTNTDGTSSTVDLKSLVAIVPTNTAEILLTGDGTNASPLAADFSPAVKAVMAQAALVEVIHIPDMTGNTSNTLAWSEPRAVKEGSIKVYRNGLRQIQGIDYTIVAGLGINLNFTNSFVINMNETEALLVEYKVTA